MSRPLGSRLPGLSARQGSLSVWTNLLARASLCWERPSSNSRAPPEVPTEAEIRIAPTGLQRRAEAPRDESPARPGGPEVLFLDEPTTGSSDPQSRNPCGRAPRGTARRCSASRSSSPRTATEEADPADQVVLIDHGCIIAQGSTPSALRRDYFQACASFPGEEIVKAPVRAARC